MTLKTANLLLLMFFLISRIILFLNYFQLKHGFSILSIQFTAVLKYTMLQLVLHNCVIKESFN